MKECEEEKYDTGHFLEKDSNYKKLEVKSTSAIRVQNNLNQKFSKTS